MNQIHDGYVGIINFANEIYGLIALGKTETRDTIYNNIYQYSMQLVHFLCN